MDTPRSTLEAYCGGEFVPATELRAAVAWMLAGWDALAAAGADLVTTPALLAREKALQDFLTTLVNWDAELGELELDVSCTLALPALLARRAQVERLSSPRPTAT